MREQERSYGISDDRRSSNFVWRNWEFVTTFIGLACTIGVWSMAVTIVDNHKSTGIYLIFCGITMAFLEVSLILEKLFGCCSEKSFAHQCWLVILAIDHWKRGVLYLVLSVACFMNPKAEWQVLLAGALMDFCGLLYFIKTIKAKKQTEPYKYKQLSVS